MCEQCESIAAAVALGHVVQFPLTPGVRREENIDIRPLDE